MIFRMLTSSDALTHCLITKVVGLNELVCPFWKLSMRVSQLDLLFYVVYHLSYYYAPLYILMKEEDSNKKKITFS